MTCSCFRANRNLEIVDPLRCLCISLERGGFNNKSEAGGENFVHFFIFCLSGACEHGWREKECSLSLVKWEENRCIAST